MYLLILQKLIKPNVIVIPSPKMKYKSYSKAYNMKYKSYSKAYYKIQKLFLGLI